MVKAKIDELRELINIIDDLYNELGQYPPGDNREVERMKLVLHLTKLRKTVVETIIELGEEE